MNLLVRLLDVGSKAPIGGHFLDRREEDVPDLRVVGREVSRGDLRPFPGMLTKRTTSYPRLAATEAGDERAELVRQCQELRLRDVKRWADRRHWASWHP